MLQICNISKQYTTGDLVQDALKDVSLNLRDNEFVAVLGPSGSGKTTLLNIIGGLDRYDDGDLVINGISTKKYRDRDWDSYRNHTIGFVFQSYNLIPHQSILSNVELALTISGISKKERRRRAVTALEQVGLGDQLHKRPNQMSGGQMQRVAIARALVNNPDILLADEPTGALDTETSVQVLELLKEVAKDRLVIMVTHNSELAETYATRIVSLRDGKITGDSNPFRVESSQAEKAEHKTMGRASMSFLTSLSLSFNNLRTKKGRTFLTAFAGSIGIIGIALILSLSTGMNDYIESIQRDTMTSYPITIDAQSIDLSSIMGAAGPGMRKKEVGHDLNAVYSDSTNLEMVNKITTSLTENNLTEFKRYLDDPDSEIRPHLGENGVIYSYDVPFGVYSRNSDGELIDANTNAFVSEYTMPYSSGALGSVQESMMGSMSPLMSSAGGSMMASETFEEMLPGSSGALVGTVTTDSYDLLFGSWPQSYDEVVLVLDENNELPTTALYALGMIPSAEYDEIMEAIDGGEEYQVKSYSYDYGEILSQTFYLVPAGNYYTENENGTFDYIGDDDQASLEKLTENAVELKISGIIRPVEGAANATISGAVGYTNALTMHIIDYANGSDIVKAQRDNPDINVVTGMSFSPSDDAAKIADARNYLSGMGVTDKAKLWREMAGAAFANNPEQLQGIASLGEAELAAMADQYFAAAGDEVFLQIYETSVSAGSFDDNMTSFGFVSMDVPSSISIYADTFEGKDAIAESIKKYNDNAEESDRIVYTDFVAMMTSSITTIINVISYVLIAFVAVSLVVSSIMIGIITYISVLERTKEIGILRAIGASKRNISQVFNAETFIIGLLSGILGIALTLLILIPGNAIIHALIGTSDVSAVLPAVSAGILIVLSVVLTLIGGLIPSKKAARKDPVAALRSE
jgi:putative ABC transport system permease protein